MTNKPDFICVGFEKAGTSWLFEMLNEHPEIEMPPVKELRYLSEGSHIPKVSLFKQYFSKHWHYQQFQQLLRSKVRAWLRNPNSFRRDHWYRKFLLKKHNDNWYRSLFVQNKVSGDITPTYTNLSSEQIGSIKGRFPDVKIIILLRHPIERLWSKMKMNLSKHTSVPIHSITEETWANEADRFIGLGYSPAEVINHWRARFDNVFVGFHDEINTDPQALLNNICAFLELSNTNFKGWNIDKKVNVGLSKDMPEVVVKTLTKAAEKEVEDLRKLIDVQVPAGWS